MISRRLFTAFLLFYCSYVSAQTNWHITGNTGTDASVNFIGTIDDVNLKFRVNNQLAGLVDDSLKNTSLGYQALRNTSTGYNNVAIGFQTLYAQTTGFDNIAVGIKALYSNTTGSNNTALGFNSLYSNISAINNTGLGQNTLYHTTANSNTAVGNNVLYTNTSGLKNTGLGESALFLNTTGNYNTASGTSALYSNTTGNYNIGSGYQSIYSNTTGSYNIASGVNALYSNISGYYNIAIGLSASKQATYASNNIAIGDSALFNNNSTYNTAVGQQSLLSNTYGFGNTAAGAFALNANKTGYSNSAFGYNSDVSDSALYNATAIGYNAIATANNQVMLGNTAVISVKAAGSYVIYSDGRYKKEIKENVPGLTFINALRPVTYRYDVQGMNDKMGISSFNNSKLAAAIRSKEQKVYTGFIAQEVDSAAKKLNYDFSGVYKPQNAKDLYGLSYADFVIPLVKSVQELSKSSNAKDSEINNLKAEIEDLKSQMEQIKMLVTGSTSNTQTAVISAAMINQNVPNPFSNVTSIEYFLPNQITSAKIIVYSKDGKEIKQINLSGKGKGKITVDASTLSAGAYNYSLYVDEKLISTKQMILAK